jgi:hypothetical protein
MFCFFKLGPTISIVLLLFTYKNYGVSLLTITLTNAIKFSNAYCHIDLGPRESRTLEI